MLQYCKNVSTALKITSEVEPAVLANQTETNSAHPFGSKLQAFAKVAFDRKVANTTKKSCTSTTLNATMKKEIQFSLYTSPHT